MAIALVTTSRDSTRRKKKLVVSGTVSGNYVTGGITIDWTTTTNPKLLSGGMVSAQPQYAEVINAPAGYSGEFVPGTTLKNWKLKVATTAGAELAAAAFPAALIADPFQFELTGPIGAF